MGVGSWLWRPRCAILAVATATAHIAAATAEFGLVDVTKAAGITFTHQNGAFGKKYLPETLGAGVAFLDYNNDGRQDILFVNGTTWPGQPHPVTFLSAPLQE